MKRISFCFFLITCFCFPAFSQKKIHHYIFFSHERERIHEKSFLKNKNIEGAQLKYFWRELEPDKDQYNLEPIKKDLEFLRSKGKKLFIQVQDVTFDTQYKSVPRYIRIQKEYHGGVAIQYRMDDNDSLIKQEGWVARRWDTAVSNRFFKLIALIAKEFDGEIEGINLDETAVTFGMTGKWWPPGYTPELYKNSVLLYMRTLRQAFSKSVVMQFANFMPGEWLPEIDHGYLKEVYAYAVDHKIGMGGPDIKVYKPGQMNHSYPLLKKYSADLITGVAVQDGNLEEINPKTGKQVTVAEVYEFAKNYLHLDYIFWGTQEPYYSNSVLPFLKQKH